MVGWGGTIQPGEAQIEARQLGQLNAKSEPSEDELLALRCLECPNLREWEREFAQSIHSWTLVGKPLTDKQRAKANQIIRLASSTERKFEARRKSFIAEQAPIARAIGYALIDGADGMHLFRLAGSGGDRGPYVAYADVTNAIRDLGARSTTTRSTETTVGNIQLDKNAP